MEWAQLHTPLEPPRGYERYHTFEAVFPGMRDAVRVRSWSHFVQLARGATRIYMHQYRHDPEVQGWLDALNERDAKVRDLRMRKRAEWLAVGAQRGRDRAERVAEAVRANAPAGKQFLAQRAEVLAHAVNEFAAGFQETQGGLKNVWGVSIADTQDEHAECLAKNRPLVYRVRDDEAQNDV